MTGLFSSFIGREDVPSSTGVESSIGVEASLEVLSDLLIDFVRVDDGKSVILL